MEWTMNKLPVYLQYFYQESVRVGRGMFSIYYRRLVCSFSCIIFQDGMIYQEVKPMFFKHVGSQIAVP